MDWKLELIIVPVSDVDRAKSFYWRKLVSVSMSTTAPARISGWCS
jgi:hypothetical protein